MVSTLTLLRHLFRHITSRRRDQLAWLFVIMVFASFAEVASIGAVLPFLGALMSPERVFAHPAARPLIAQLHLSAPRDLMLPLTVLFVSAAVFSGGMRLILLWAQTRLGHAIGADFSLKIYRNTLYQPYAVHVARNSSQVIAGISTKANVVVGGALLPLLNILSSSLLLLTVLVVLVAINPLVTVAAFGGFGGLYGVVAITTRSRLGHHSKRVSQESTKVIKALQEGLGGIRDVLIDGTQATYCEVYREADLPLRRSLANLQILAGAPRFLVESLGMALIAILAYGLASREHGIAGAIPVLGALAVGAQRMLPVFQQLYASWSASRGSQISVQDVLELLDQPLPRHADDCRQGVIPFRSSIQLHNLGFRYSEGAPWVLRGIDLKIHKGTRLGLMGVTGSGKSTLLDILMALLAPSEGTLAIDGTPITAKNHRAWQAHIAHVPQAIFLADATIAENIAFGVPSERIDHARIRRAARDAQIADTIESMGGKYDTKVGERGVRLSGGQRQRIGIARALYKEADVIVLDEATSALDDETERNVMDAIRSIGKDITVLIVAHRLTTLSQCDSIIKLDCGEIVGAGTYEEMVIGGACAMKKILIDHQPPSFHGLSEA